MKIISKIYFLLTFYLLLCMGANAQTPVEINGKLKLVGVQLSSECGNPVQLRGMSTHGLQWFGNCVNGEGLNALKTEWHSDVVRIVMYVKEGGYLEDSTGWKARLDALVDEIGKRGMYCIIDWHIHKEGDPNVFQKEAKDFWRYMSKKHAGKKHIMYEIANEPSQVGWEEIQKYAEAVIPVIRANDPESIIIVGTPQYCQQPWLVTKPLTGALGYNVMYAFHFYTAVHEWYRSQIGRVLKTLPIFATEWGTSTDNGGGKIDLDVAQDFADIFAGKNDAGVTVSWCNWSFSDKGESSAALNPGSCGSGQWNNTSPSGTKIKYLINNPPKNFISCNGALQIKNQPSDANIKSGDSASFKVVALGNNLHYQWSYKSVNGIWKEILSATQPVLTIKSADTNTAGQYKVKVYNDKSSVESIIVTLKVETFQMPAITNQPKDISVKTGAKSDISVTATGEKLSYQWFISKDSGKIWTEINGATLQNFSINKTSASNIGWYKVKVSNSTGMVESTPATITIVNPQLPIITQQPTDISIKTGATATFNVSASGENLSYQWQTSVDSGKTWSDIKSEISPLFSIFKADNKTSARYRVKVSNLDGSVLSNTAALNIIPLSSPVITLQPIDVKAKSGKSASFKVLAQGENLTYQWKITRDSGKVWLDISGAIQQDYNIEKTSVKEQGSYKVVVSNSDGSVESKAVTLFIIPISIPSITLEPKDQKVKSGSPVDFVVQATGENLSYQWLTSNDSGKTWTKIKGANKNSYAIDKVNKTDEGLFKVKVSNEDSIIESRTTVLNVFLPAAPVITAQPVNAEVKKGSNVNFTVTAQGEDLTYSWEISKDNGATWLGITAATMREFSKTMVIEKDSGLYKVVVSNIAGRIESNIVSLKILPLSPPLITLQPMDVAAKIDSRVSFSVKASGADLKYQWAVSLDSGKIWKDVAGANLQNFSILKLNYPHIELYKVKVENRDGAVVSNTVSLTIISSNPPIIIKQPESIKAIVGKKTNFSVIAEGIGVTYQWIISHNNGKKWDTIKNAILPVFSIVPTLSDTGIYKVIVSNTDGSIESNIVSLTISTVITSTPDDHLTSVTDLFSFHPNPVENLLNIYCGREEVVLASLFDNTGKLILEEKFVKVAIIDIPLSVTPGIYHLRVIVNSRIYFQKLLKY